MIRKLLKSVILAVLKVVILNLIFYYLPFIPLSRVNPCLIPPCSSTTSAYTPQDAILKSEFFAKYVEKIGAHRAGTESFADAVRRVLNQDVIAGNAVLVALLAAISFRAKS